VSGRQRAELDALMRRLPLAGPPSMLIQAGTHEILLGDAIAAGEGAKALAREGAFVRPPFNA
jgi:hypothetical protein